MENKECYNCKIIFDISFFCKRYDAKDGLSSYCRDCRRIKYRLKRANNPDTFKNKDKKYYHKNREKIQNSRKSYSDECRRKVSAHYKVNYAVKKGYIIKPSTCSKCNESGRIEGHHEDYSKPLEVSWLCKTCHMRLHADAPQEQTF